MGKGLVTKPVKIRGGRCFKPKCYRTRPQSCIFTDGQHTVTAMGKPAGGQDQVPLQETWTDLRQKNMNELAPYSLAVPAVETR
jgi:hypothetical protein